jgi:hypothetical protein
MVGWMLVLVLALKASWDGSLGLSERPSLAQSMEGLGPRGHARRALDAVSRSAGGLGGTS